MFRLRHDFDVEKSPVNALHGASNAEQAERELKKFFPVEQTLAVLKPGLTLDKKRKFDLFSLHHRFKKLLKNELLIF